jgi:acetyl-CoA C-acetyltransferase
MIDDPIVIVGIARTPMGGFQGEFSSVPASKLGVIAINAALCLGSGEATAIVIERIP